VCARVVVVVVCFCSLFFDCCCCLLLTSYISKFCYMMRSILFYEKFSGFPTRELADRKHMSNLRSAA
jgi:hypothetical protein